MSDTKAVRYVGHPDGIEDFRVPVGDQGESRRRSLAHGDDLPTEIDGQAVPASFIESLLEQKDNWVAVKAKPKTTAPADKD